MNINKLVSYGRHNTPKTKRSVRKILMLMSVEVYFRDQIEKNNSSIYFLVEKVTLPK